MSHAPDLLSGDLFAGLPKTQQMAAGSWNFRQQFAVVMAKAIRECGKPRSEIVEEMSRLLGRKLSEYTMDKYTSMSAENYHPSLELAMVFDAVTGQMAFANFYAEKLACRMLPGKESLFAELGKLEQMKREIARQERSIKKALDG